MKTPSSKNPSLTRRLLLNLSGAIAFQSTLIFLVLYWQLDYRIWLPVSALLTLFLLIVAINWFLAPIADVVSALETGVSAMKDNDFSITIHNKQYDELDTLVQFYNDLSDVLRKERSSLMQRELLLDKVIQSTPVAMILTNNADQIVYSNKAAHTLLNEPRPDGKALAELIRDIPATMRAATTEKRDGLFTESVRGETVVYSLNCQKFMLQNQPHHLYLYKNLTTEISRNEIALWKQVIRLISHELNNSLAPISSMTGSAKKILQQQKNLDMLPDMLDTIERRAQRLFEFTRQYARLARLPAARKQDTNLAQFLSDIERVCALNTSSDFQNETLSMDSAQIEQVLINIVKNAKESGSEPDEVRLIVRQNQDEIQFEVTDRGSGLGSEQISQAMLPFYTTKKSGTGIGLPLCNEIITGHGGRLRIGNRKGGGVRVLFSIPISQAKK
jgi:nitrogen fixation/metabolism regulation signal transduction histidine kinase